MPTLKKNTQRKPSKKANQSKTTDKATRVPPREIQPPEKFERMNEMLKKATFLP